MFALDYYREVWGGLGVPDGAAVVIAMGLVFAAVVGLLYALEAMWRYPTMLYIMAGGIGFWVLALSGHPWLSFGLLIGCLVPSLVVTSIQERRGRDHTENLSETSPANPSKSAPSASPANPYV